MLPAVLVLRVILPNFQIGSYKVMGDLGRGIDSTSLYGVCSFAQDFYIGKTGWHESHSHSRRAERGKRVTEAHCTALAQRWLSSISTLFSLLYGSTETAQPCPPFISQTPTYLK